MDEAVINAIADNLLTRAWALVALVAVVAVAFCVSLFVFRWSSKRVDLSRGVYPDGMTTHPEGMTAISGVASIVLLFLLIAAMVNVPWVVATIDNPRAAAIRIFAGK